MAYLKRSGLDTDGVISASSHEQKEVERNVMKLYSVLHNSEGIAKEAVYLLKERHQGYLQYGIRHLSASFECLDASRPWLCYWIVHSMSLLKTSIDDDLASDIIKFLSKCRSSSGGFAGGPGQLAHLAPTYAAVLCLCTIGTKQAYDAIDRPNLQRFLKSLHQEDGSFIMHEDGETDIRGVYCALVSATLTNTMTSDITRNTADWLLTCQTYEGGFSAVPGTEAHGGYTFCGLSACVLLGSVHRCDIRKLLRWISRKQMKLEGGFQGRTNKLVDGCYSFWQGAVFPLIYVTLKEEGDTSLHPDQWHFSMEALQEYVLYCCQNPRGGLHDKPGKSRDFYHTCYCLSGLSIAQHCYGSLKVINITMEPDSVLTPTHPVFNIVNDKAQAALQYFHKLSEPKHI